jgi:hypothetical protein
MLDPDLALISLRAFFAFSLTASFIYVINDIADRDRDRMHHKKRLRPIASGEISIWAGYSIAFVLLALAAIVVAGLNWKFDACLAAYLLMNVAYSFYFKRPCAHRCFCNCFRFYAESDWRSFGYWRRKQHMAPSDDNVSFSFSCNCKTPGRVGRA